MFVFRGEGDDFEECFCSLAVEKNSKHLSFEKKLANKLKLNSKGIRKNFWYILYT